MELELFDLGRPVAGTKTTKRKKKWHQVLSQIVYDFAENTSLNGLKYMSGKQVSVVGKIFWIFMFILSTILCSKMVYKTYMKWEQDSVIITLKEQLLSVNEVPFPAITICPQAMIRQEYYNYTEAYYMYLTSDVNESVEFSDKKFHSTSALCGSKFENVLSRDVKNAYTDIDTIFEVSPKLEDVLDECIWRNKYNCTDAFHPVLTAKGVCFTFNSLAADEIFRKNSVQQPRLYINTSTPQNGWSLYDNYENDNGSQYPARGRGNGAYEDLLLALKDVTDRDFVCEEHTRTGYKVYLHHPADLPQASLHYYAAHPERTTSFALKLNILGTSKGIVNYSPEVRQCYFPHERHLQFFQNYTAKNCQLECLANYTLKRCGCVSFYMPHDYADYEGLGDGNGGQCQCLSSCYDIEYDSEIIVTKFDQKEFDKKMEHLNCLSSYLNRFSENIETETDVDSHVDAASNKVQSDIIETTTEISSSARKDAADETENHTSSSPDCKSSNYDEAATRSDSKVTLIRMYYRHPQFMAMERSELFGLSQFLADCGGTLGLFLGFSFLTLAEIFYFFTLKLCCNSRQVTLKEN